LSVVIGHFGVQLCTIRDLANIIKSHSHRYARDKIIIQVELNHIPDRIPRHPLVKIQSQKFRALEIHLNDISCLLISQLEQKIQLQLLSDWKLNFIADLEFSLSTIAFLPPSTGALVVQ
jgi:hypothetical protein